MRLDWWTGPLNAAARERLAVHHVGLDMSARVCRFNAPLSDDAVRSWAMTCSLDALAVCEVDGQPVAILELARVRLSEGLSCWEPGVSVWESHRNRGCARMLLRAFLSRVPVSERLHVHSRRDNVPLLSLSRSLSREFPHRVHAEFLS